MRIFLQSEKLTSITFVGLLLGNTYSEIYGLENETHVAHQFASSPLQLLVRTRCLWPLLVTSATVPVAIHETYLIAVTQLEERDVVSTAPLDQRAHTRFPQIPMSTIVTSTLCRHDRGLPVVMRTMANPNNPTPIMAVDSNQLSIPKHLYGAK